MHKNRVTNSIIVGLATLVATATWAGLRGVFFGDSSWIWPSVGFFILLIFLGLNWLLTKSKPILLTTIVFVLISFLFAFSFHLEYIGILFLAFLFFTFGSWRSINEKEDRIKIDTIKILKKGLPFVLTGLCLVIASAYYFSPLSSIGQEKIEIPRPVFDKVVQPIIGTVGEIAPVDQISEQQDTIYQAVNGEINKRSQVYKGFFPISLSIGIFFALKVVGIPFMWLAILLTTFIFRILIWTKAVHIQEKSVLKEVIEI